MSERESSVERYFSRLVATRLGGRAVKLPAGSERGLPDRLVLLPGGRLELVELKALGGRLSPIQRIWIERAGELGVKVSVVWGREGVDQWVEELLGGSGSAE